MPYKAKLTTRTLSTSTVTTDNLNKGSELTFQQADSNFLNLRDQTIGIAGDDSTTIEIGAGNTLKVAGAGTVTTAVSGQTLTITGTGGSGSTGNITFNNNEIGTINTNEDMLLNPNGTGKVQVAGGAGLYVGTTATGTPGSGTDGNIARITEGFVDFNNNGDLTGDFIIYGPKGQEAGYKTPFQVKFSSSPSGEADGELLLYSQSWPRSDGTAGQVLKTDGAGQLTWTTVGSGLTLVGDDSTGTFFNPGETIKIAGSQNVTTAVSGDTLTITGPNLSSYLTNSTLNVVGDDSTGVTLNSGETIKIAGATGITTAVSGDTLTITGTATPNVFNTIAIAGQSDVVADTSTDTLTLVAGTNITLTTNSSTDTITINAATASAGNITFDGNNISTTNSNEDIVLDPAGTGTIQLRGNLDLNDNVITSSSGSLNVKIDKNIVLSKETNSSILVDNSTKFLMIGASGGATIGIGYDSNTASNSDDTAIHCKGLGRLNLYQSGTTGLTSTTIGANGAASALTANPVGYVKIKVNGTEYQIPYYNI